MGLAILQAQSQVITGYFSELANQKVYLIGFEGFGTYEIAKGIISENGSFQLNYSQSDYGMGFLSAEDNKPFFVILSGEDIILKGESFNSPATVKILKGNENQLFEQYATEHPRREQALSAWDYLEKIYSHDSLFAVHAVPKEAIVNEKQRIKTEESLFLANIDPQSYVSWYLPVRKLVSLVPTIAQYRIEDIPSAIATFRKMDYTDPRLYKSGLLGDVIESHFWLIENSGRSLDSVFIEMNISIDYMIANLLSDERKFNEFTSYLFKLLESRSLFGSSEYLALKILNETSCTIDRDLEAQLESYRAMKIGNTAPDFNFQGDVIATGYIESDIPKKLSDMKSKYKVLIIGASWCPKCSEELKQTERVYKKWKDYGVEVIFISLDENVQSFKSFSGSYPFISICDYQKWESPIVKAYHVFATPTIYLLDTERKILLRPNSVNHMDSWVDWYLIQGNK